MTAGHYIGLLLLSTVPVGSREHCEIVEANSQGIWLSLSDVSLVEREPSPPGSDLMLWRLTERGRVLVEHVLDLPLPERVNAWRMRPALADFVPGPIHFVPAESPAITASEVLARQQPEDDGPPPPKPPAPKPIQGITPAEDPAERRNQARELINRGFGTSEIAQTLEMEQLDVESIFFERG